MTDIPLDKFYTPDATARQCIGQLWRQVGMRADDLFIEPSAGAGAFCRHLPAKRTIALDIAPDADGILTGDFLDFEPPVHEGRRIVIGNPPFGRSGAMARAFLQHASKFADVIAFILPASFAKASMQRGIPSLFHLVHQTHLGDATFETCEGLRKVRTVLQIWEKRDCPRAEQTCLPATQHDFEFVRTIAEADLIVRRVGARAGAVLAIPPLPQDGALPLGYSASSNFYIRSKGCDPETLARRLRDLNLAGIAAAAVCPSLSRQELVSAYAEVHHPAAAANDAAHPSPEGVTECPDAPACSPLAEQAGAALDRMPRSARHHRSTRHHSPQRVPACLQPLSRARRSSGDCVTLREARHQSRSGQTEHPVLRPGARQGVAPRPPDKPICAIRCISRMT